MRKKITIISNSVSLRIRPPDHSVESGKKVYSSILEDELNKNQQTAVLWEVSNQGLSRLLIKEVYDDSDQYIRTFPDILILNIGCVDAPNRDIPLWYSDIIFKRKYKKLYKIFYIFHCRFIKTYLRRYLVFLRGKKSWVSHSKFKFYFDEVLTLFLKETNAKIIVIGINAGNEKIETLLPGTIEKYNDYSEIIKQLCIKHHIEFIDVSDMDSEIYFPDGVHYNAIGHKEVADRLLKVIYKLI